MVIIKSDDKGNNIKKDIIFSHIDTILTIIKPCYIMSLQEEM